MQHGRAGDIERSFVLQIAKIDPRDWARGIAEAGEQAAGGQAIQRHVECVFAHPVIDHRHFGPIGDISHAFRYILGGVVDDVSASMGAGELCLFLRAHGADHGDTQFLCPLAGNEATPSGGCVEENGFARFHFIGLFEEIADSQALHHQGGRFLFFDAIGEFDQTGGETILRF